MLVKVNGCEINGKKHGEQVEVTEKEGKHLIAIGYALEVEQPVKAEPKKPATKRATNKK